MKVLFHLTWMAAFVVVATFSLAFAVQATTHKADPLCARACYEPGVTANPDIVLMNGGE